MEGHVGTAWHKCSSNPRMVAWLPQDPNKISIILCGFHAHWVEFDDELLTEQLWMTGWPRSHSETTSCQRLQAQSTDSPAQHSERHIGAQWLISLFLVLRVHWFWAARRKKIVPSVFANIGYVEAASWNSRPLFSFSRRREEGVNKKLSLSLSLSSSSLFNPFPKTSGFPIQMVKTNRN